MIEDIQKKILSIRQAHADKLDRLIDDPKHKRISADEYRMMASTARTEFFQDDKIAHEELAECFNRFKDTERPTWLRNPPKE